MSVDAALKIFILAGVKTRSSAFHAFEERLYQAMESRGIQAQIELLFPYGDADRALLRQLIEVRTDLSSIIKNAGFSGRSVWSKIEPFMNNSKLLFIGHSGGGVAAYQLARRLMERNKNMDSKIIQIGSPRTKIQPELQDRVAYFHSVDGNGRYKDPITKLGSWGGWSVASSKLPVVKWDSFKYAPSHIEGVETIGGHADYFRHTEEFTDEQTRCNLDKIIHKIEAWLLEWL